VRFLFRLFASIFIACFFLCTFVFLIYSFVPSAPVEALILKSSHFTSKATLSEQAKKSLREQLQLNIPLYKRYFHFILGTLKGDLGESLWTGQPVTTLIKKRALPTFSFAFWTLFFSISFGLVFGLLQAFFCSRWQGVLCGFLLNVLFCVPSFALATFLAFSDSNILRSLGPLAVYLAVPVPYLALLIRKKILKEEREPYTTAVLAKGLSRWQLHYRHLIRPCRLTVISFLPMSWSLFWGTSLVVEPIFRIQGLGTLALEGFRNQDLPLLTGVTLIIGFGRIILNTLREVLSSRLLPLLEIQDKK
jgi:peptide/nickel transport system permease protein